VEAPNYDFSLKTFEPLTPGNKLEDIKEKYPDLKLVHKKEDTSTYKLKLTQLRYVFPVFIQVRSNTVVDFYARLPQYFLHDLFHQSLINKLGIQDQYKRVDEHAVYVWTKKETKHIYEGACTITCFPIYYSSHIFDKSLTPLVKSMNQQTTKALLKTP
jgi:hypothetical protein